MNINMNVYHYPDQATAAQLDRIENMLGIIQQNQEDTMATLEEVQALQADTDAVVAVVAADVAALLDKIANFPKPGLTAEQQAAVDDIAAHAGRINDSLSGIDSSANPPAAPSA